MTDRGAATETAASARTDPMTGGPAMAELPADHPGFTDPEYRARRGAIAAAAAAWQPGDPIPEVHYTDAEHDVWRRVQRELAAKHDHYACHAYLDGAAALDLPTDEVPQLRAVSARLQQLTGFRIAPAPGLVPTRVFYGRLAERLFTSTQYLRHHSVPLYTPEPDVLHELVGHANALAEPGFAALYEAAGEASLRCTSDAALDAFSRIFWFTLEFGVLWEGGELRTYGAGLLSSFGEIEAFRSAEIRPFDLAAMAVQPYDITQFQPVLFAASSWAAVLDELGTFFEGFGDEAHQRLLTKGGR